MAQLKELSLQKGAEKFVFRYEPGQEEAVLDALVDKANDRANNFDWFDAAVLSFQLSKHLVEQADELLCSTGSSLWAGSSGSEASWNSP